MNTPSDSEVPKPKNGGNSFDTSEQMSEILDFSHLYDEQRRFFEWLYTVPALERYQRYWKIQPSPQLDLELAKKVLSTASSGEAHMLRFLAGVWLGSNTFEFDMFDAVRDLDTQELSIIQSWVQNPFYP